MFLYVPALMTFCFAIYVFIRCIVPFPYQPLVKKIFLILLIIISQAMTISRILADTTHQIPLLSLRVGGFVLGTLLIFTVLLFFRDFILLALYVFRKISGGASPNIISFFLSQKIVLHTLLCMAVLLTSMGMYPALKVPDIKNQTIYIPNLPVSLEGFRIAQLSDLHIGSTFNHSWLEKVVKKTNDLNADIVLVTGDMVDGLVSEIGKEVNSLADLESRYGTYLCAGNHEYYSGLQAWKNHFESMGLTFLLNNNVQFDIGTAKLVVAGIADSGHGRYANPTQPDPEKALKNTDPDAIRILMGHQPKDAYVNAKYGYHLQLAGHTHGGLAFPLFSLIAAANNGFLSGLYQVNDMQLYVSPGTGLWGYIPLRLLCPSEITLITLKNKI